MSRRRRLINLKVSPSEYARIEELAQRHTQGNVSLWLRQRGMSEDDEANDDGESEDGGVEADPVLRRPPGDGP
jgi:hypothetical protein